MGSDCLDEDLRAQLSTVRPALDAFLSPGSIAVVGASADPGTLSGLLFANLLGSGFSGTLLPVNRHHDVVQGLPAYPDLASCPVAPDLVIACVPAPAVAGVVAEAGDAGSRAVCVISAGFAETGAAGAALQARLVEVAAAHGVRLVGPNCTGMVGGKGALRFNATFGGRVPGPGSICLASQSGAFGLGVLEAMEARGLGIGSFVSVGNTVDVGMTDLLLYWGEKPETDLVLLYLESVAEAQRFVRVARHVSRKVPVVVLKAGRTSAGRRGAASHTAAVSSGDVAVGAVLRQAGVIRAESVEEVLDLATMMGGGQRCRGRRVGIVTNGGGAGVIAADACEGNGLVVPELGEATATALRSLLPPEASVANPVDMIASATERHYADVVRVLGRSPDVDALIVVFNIPVLTRGTDVAAELVAARRVIDADVPLVAVFMNRDGPPAALREAGIPAFVFPENAARALADATIWQEGRDRCLAVTTAPRSRPPVQAAVPGPRARDGWLGTGEAQALLEEYGIAVPRSARVRTPEEAAAAQAKIGGTVVLKVAAAIHKSEVGGVRLGLTTPAEVADALVAVRADLEAAGLAGTTGEFLVQEQVAAGPAGRCQEMIVGAHRDPVLGPLVVVGLGGKLVEVLGDVAVRLAPLSVADATDMVASLKSSPLLTGYRGEAALDTDALVQVVEAVSALVEDHPEVAEMDLNPVMVLEKGAVAVDVRIRTAAPGHLPG